MKHIILAVLIVIVSGCGKFDRGIAAVTGSATSCVNGVEYIQFTSGASVAYNPDGKVRTCK